MSVPVPPILQTYTPFPYPILSAFPVHFRIKETIHYPARSEKRGQKPERDTILSRSFAVRIHKRAKYIAPIRFRA